MWGDAIALVGSVLSFVFSGGRGEVVACEVVLRLDNRVEDEILVDEVVNGLLT